MISNRNRDSTINNFDKSNSRTNVSIKNSSPHATSPSNSFTQSIRKLRVLRANWRSNSIGREAAWTSARNSSGSVTLRTFALSHRSSLGVAPWNDSTKYRHAWELETNAWFSQTSRIIIDDLAWLWHSDEHSQQNLELNSGWSRWNHVDDRRKLSGKRTDGILFCSSSLLLLWFVDQVPLRDGR